MQFQRLAVLLNFALPGLLCLTLSDAAFAAETEAKRPNVLVILTDDMRWDAMSCAGHPWFKTPNLDRLASEGARFTNAFVTTSLCSPSRASLLTGVYANRHRVLNNFTDLPENLPSYPQQLKDAGYETAYIGKWHMGEQDDRPRKMFDFWMSHKGQGNYWDNNFNINGKEKVLPGYYTTVVTDAAIDWLKKPHEKPWLLVLGQKAPHGGPIVPDKKYEHIFDNIDPQQPKNADSYHTADGKPKWLEAQYKTWHGLGGPLYNNHDYAKFARAYFGTIVSVDDSVGQIYKTLEDAGALDNTLIIFLSDNGFALGEHGRVDKRTMYEESIRIPLIVRYPRLIPKAKTIDDSVLSLDLAPSILEICGAKPIEGASGKSWKPLLAGDNKNWDRPWLYEYNYETEFPYTPNVRGVRLGNWKYIRYPHGDGGKDRYTAELYDLTSDPLEQHNLINDPKAKEMKEKLSKSLEELLKENPRSLEDLPIDDGIKTTLPRF